MHVASDQVAEAVGEEHRTQLRRQQLVDRPPFQHAQGYQGLQHLSFGQQVAVHPAHAGSHGVQYGHLRVEHAFVNDALIRSELARQRELQKYNMLLNKKDCLSFQFSYRAGDI